MNPEPSARSVPSPRPFTPWELALPISTLIAILVPSALVWHIPFFWSLGAGWLVAVLIALRAGYPYLNLLEASWRGVRETLLVITVIAMIGALMAVWFQSGTIPALVYHSLKVALPEHLPIWSFVATLITSFLLGSAIGTVGTVGVTLMGVGQALDVSAPLMAGAIVSGAFVGDRTSLVSSIFQMLAQSTKVEPLRLFPVLLKTGIPTIVLCLIAYAAFGWYTFDPPSISQSLSTSAAGTVASGGFASETSAAIVQHYRIDAWTLLPAAAMLVLAAMRVRIRWCLVASIGAACIVAVLLQGTNLPDVLRAMIFGYPGAGTSESLAGLKGGGVWSTLDVLTLLIAAGALNGILTHCGMLRQLLKQTIARIRGRFALVCFSGVLSVLMGAVTCTQTLTILLPGPLLRPLYFERGLSDELLARTLADTGLVAVGLVPWSLLSLIFTTALGVPAQAYAPYAFFLWFLPLVTLAASRREARRLPLLDVADAAPHVPSNR